MQDLSREFFNLRSCRKSRNLADVELTNILLRNVRDMTELGTLSVGLNFNSNIHMITTLHSNVVHALNKFNSGQNTAHVYA